MKELKDEHLIDNEDYDWYDDLSREDQIKYMRLLRKQHKLNKLYEEITSEILKENKQYNFHKKEYDKDYSWKMKSGDIHMFHFTMMAVYEYRSLDEDSIKILIDKKKAHIEVEDFKRTHDHLEYREEEDNYDIFDDMYQDCDGRWHFDDDDCYY